MVALVQQDFKFVIGYSSVSHMGFVLLGLMTLNQIGMTGAVLQMYSHGIIAGLLFAVVGRMVYDRTHTRELSVLQGMRLSKAIPFAVLIGAWVSFPLWAILAGFGLVVGIAYTWRAMQKAFFSEGSLPPAGAVEPLPPITIPERIGALLLIAATITIGVYPQLLLRIIAPALNSPLFEGLRRVAAR